MGFSLTFHQTGVVQFPLHIGGSWQENKSNVTMQVLRPATSELLATVVEASAEDVNAACLAAFSAFQKWSRTDTDTRALHLRRLADIVRARMTELASLESAITGRPLREMQAQMSRIPEWLEYFAGIILGLEGESNQLKGGFLTYTQYKPLGVCALLTPWNHPILILVKKLAAALAAGNTVIIKPSELAPVTPLFLAEWANEAGFPPGAVNVVTGGASTGAAVVAHPKVARIDLTGGTTTGKHVAAAAAQRLVPCTLELGGKTPVLIFEDAQQDQAVAGALFAAFVAAGQTCVSGSRFLVQASIYDEFLEKFCKRVASLKVGDPANPSTDVGPVISAASRDRCMAFIDDSHTEGARLSYGGHPLQLDAELQNGFFVPPTVFSDVTPSMRLFREEVFGPVVSFTPFQDEKEAIDIANDTDFALGAAIWSQNIHRAHRVASQIKAGVTWLNDHHKNDPRSIWGGYELSGYGKENGWDALKSYMNKGSVVVRTQDHFDDWFQGGKRYG